MYQYSHHSLLTSTDTWSLKMMKSQRVLYDYDSGFSSSWTLPSLGLSGLSVRGDLGE
ncbi:hypothetical protein OIDMADRAFT_18916 [Oidiodendron maius Zn]|uniref:Uncharacterized protein n=1 Tax=Oidiodendron maius (strain Zn) TaxID=913774 RepID=A0A0C3CTG5_OIDMZ|nr:hypothetical protein OIDMADRAFT_18916 [Oidiodendron maius Zn]